MRQVLDQLPVLGLRMVVGGLLVVAFAIIVELSEPKKLAGLFTAAPGVALGGLLITLATKGAGEVGRAAFGMIAGAIAMVVYRPAVPLHPAARRKHGRSPERVLRRRPE